MIISTIIVLIPMIVLGLFLVAHVKATNIRALADSDARYLGAIVAPLLQDAGVVEAIPPAVEKRLDETLEASPIGEHHTTNLWRRDGTIIYSTDKSVVGKRLPSSELDSAFAGEIVAQLDELSHHGTARQESAGTPLLEIYVPIYHSQTGEIIAVGEFYENARTLQSQLTGARYATWGMIGAATALMMTLLYVTTHKTGTVVRSQQQRLAKNYSKMRELARQKSSLRRYAEQARISAIKANQDILAEIGADLHDGPIQLLSLLILHLNAAKTTQPPERSPAAELAADILRQLRNLSNGLVLPEIDHLTLEETLRLAVRRHEALTGTKVEVHLESLPRQLAPTLKVAGYRVIQECLNNAFRHAGGIGQAVYVRVLRRDIEIVVSDEGPGIADVPATEDVPRGIGMSGLHKRIGNLGGFLEIRSVPGKGTVITARLPINGASRPQLG